jgi:hypothetical protein
MFQSVLTHANADRRQRSRRPPPIDHQATQPRRIEQTLWSPLSLGTGGGDRESDPDSAQRMTIRPARPFQAPYLDSSVKTGRPVARGEPIEFQTFDGHADHRLRLAPVAASQGRLRDRGSPGDLARRLSRAGRTRAKALRTSNPIASSDCSRISGLSEGAFTLRAMMEVARGEPIVTAA